MCFLLLAVNAAYVPWAANNGNGCPLGYMYGYGNTMCVPIPKYVSAIQKVAEVTQAHLKNQGRRG